MDCLKNLNQIDDEEEDDSEDDEDYVPSKEDLENDDDGEKEDDDEDSSGSEESENDADGAGQKKKNKRRGRKRKASSVSKDDAENVSEDGNKELTSEEKKKKADDLWAELNNPTSLKADPKPALETKVSTEAKVEEKVYEFAGEKVVVKEPSKAKAVSSTSSSSSAQSSNSGIPVIKRSGLKDLVSNLGKKNKLGTLQKSKIDWDSFKRDEGIEDELKQATLSKDGYVEKQAFLSRADYRQFEIEKTIRSKIRKPQ